MPSGIFNLKQQIQEITLGAWSGQKTPAVEYLVVAGGGGGGATIAGAGGAGGLLQGLVSITAGNTLTVTVGGGGTGSSSSSTPGANGQNSVFGSVTAIGGGGGGADSSSASAYSGQNGGSGGGAGYNVTTPSALAPVGQGTFGQGNPGGTSVTSSAHESTGGGGGAGTPGGNASYSPDSGGIGGTGIASAINGPITAYAGGGGGGGSNVSTAVAGGVGGGGSGSVSGHTASTAGTTNTGGGGGGGRDYSGGSGGSGIVAISYPDIYNAPTAITGTYTANTSGSGSVNLNGSSPYVTYPQNSAFAFGSGAFTVEFWIYPTANIPGYAQPFGTGTSTNDFIIDVQSIGLYLDVNNNAVVIATSTIALTLNAWNHVAITRGASGSTLYIFINGQIGASVTNSTSWTNTGSVIIGKNPASNVYVPAYISNLRVVKGTQVYSSAFTPPTAPLTAIANTSLLLNTVSPSALNDSSTNAFTPTAYNNPTWNQLSPFATGLGYKNRVYTWTSSGTVTF